MKKITALLLAVFMVLSLCACGSAAKSDSYAPQAAPAMMEESAAYDYAMEMEAPMAEPAEAFGGFSASNTAAAAGGDAPAEKPADINPEKIIYSANARLETTTFDDTLARLNDMIASMGGFIESSSVNGANYYSQTHGLESNRSAGYTIRIPSARFSELMGSLPTLGNVPYTNTYTENITSQYYDVQARLNAYKTQETRLLEMMEIAETVEDIILLEDRLTEVRYQIESMQSTINNWDRQVSYSSVYLDVAEVSEYTPSATLKVTYGEKFVAAVKDGFKSVGNFFANFLLWLVEALPTLVIFGLVVWGIVAGVKKSRKNAPTRAQRKAERAAKKAAGKNPAPAAEEPASGDSQ